jgi:hypothetical protein
VSPRRVGFAITMCHRSCTDRISTDVGLVTEIPGTAISHGHGRVVLIPRISVPVGLKDVDQHPSDTLPSSHPRGDASEQTRTGQPCGTGRGHEGGRAQGGRTARPTLLPIK